MLAFEQQHLLATTPMTLKGGAFLATVPAPDRRAAIPRRVQAQDPKSQIDAEAANETTLNAASPDDNAFAAEFAIDFVGPSIDTGFRVLKYATREYFVLTAEVAHRLFKHYSTKELDDRKAYPVGAHVLKGVWGGQPYPVFALACDLGEKTPAQMLAATFNDNSVITDDCPSYAHSRPHDVLGPIGRYRTARGWQGAIVAPEAEHSPFRSHQAAVDMRRRVENDFVDT